MTELPQDIQLALVSFLAALLIGGPVALFGASNFAGIARFAGALFLRHRIATGLTVSLLGGAGFFSSSLMTSQQVAAQGWLGGLLG